MCVCTVRAFLDYGVIDVGKERKKTDVTLPEPVPEGLFQVSRVHPEDRVAALAGNPNVGKSTVFNTLTGLRQHTGYCKYGEDGSIKKSSVCVMTIRLRIRPQNSFCPARDSFGYVVRRFAIFSTSTGFLGCSW